MNKGGDGQKKESVPDVSNTRLCWIQHTTFAEKIQELFQRKGTENRIFGETHKFGQKFPANCPTSIKGKRTAAAARPARWLYNAQTVCYYVYMIIMEWYLLRASTDAVWGHEAL